MGKERQRVVANCWLKFDKTFPILLDIELTIQVYGCNCVIVSRIALNFFSTIVVTNSSVGRHHVDAPALPTTRSIVPGLRVVIISVPFEPNTEQIAKP